MEDFEKLTKEMAKKIVEETFREAVRFFEDLVRVNSAGIKNGADEEMRYLACVDTSLDFMMSGDKEYQKRFIVFFHRLVRIAVKQKLGEQITDTEKYFADMLAAARKEAGR